MQLRHRERYSKRLAMTLKKKIIIGAAIVMGGVVGWYFYQRQNTPVAVQTEVVKRGDVSETVSVTGTLNPEQYADLSFQTGGTIDQVDVSEGVFVHAGDRIVSVDRKVLYSGLKDARLAVAVAEQNELVARRNKSGLYVKASIKANKLLTEQARQKVRTIEVQMAENILTAPFDGQISRVDARIGETVTPSQAVVRIAAPGSFLLEARVPESDIAKVALGMKAQVTFDALTNDDIFEATVETIEHSATVVQGVVSYNVKFRLTEIDPRLRGGMTGNIDVETAKRTAVLWVPFRALVKEGTKSYAKVKRADSTFEKVEVSVGLEGDDGTVEVKSGLREGEEVAIGAIQSK